MERSTRRQFLGHATAAALGAAWAGFARGQSSSPATATGTRPASTSAPAPIDRRAVVSRHDVRLRGIDPSLPVQLGNGDFAFGCDVTGLQTLAEAYRPGVPLMTMAGWAWRAGPALPPIDATLRGYRAPGKPSPVTYADAVAHPATTQQATRPERAVEAFALLSRPERAALGRVALVDGAGAALGVARIDDAEQSLELWTGLLSSRFAIDGQRVEVTTAAHPSRAIVALRVRSPLLASGGLALGVALPTQRINAPTSGPTGEPDDFSDPLASRTTVLPNPPPGTMDVTHAQDDFAYRARWSWGEAAAARCEASGPHAFVVRAMRESLDFVVEFAPPAAAPSTAPSASGPSATTEPAADAALPSADEVFAASAKAWERFWLDGAAIDLAGCADPRAAELERRVVRSRYLLAVHCAGERFAGDGGLACNAYTAGKTRLDTAWWTSAHHAMWGHPEALERSMAFYELVGPAARATAERQGYDGARWPAASAPVLVDGKLVGGEAPGESWPFLIWQQPHAIYFAEQLYRAKPTRETLDRWAWLVNDTARFMASFAQHAADAPADTLSLGPPLATAQGEYVADRAQVRDATFELAYWAWGLGVAQRWRERAGESRDPRWDEVIKRLNKPRVTDGRYAAIDVPPFLVARGLPSHLMALGAIPKTHLIDEPTMRETVRWTAANWAWDAAPGASFAAAAQTAARLGEAELAIDLLLKESPANRFLENGHHAPQEVTPVALTANGALLAAIALMAGGWDGLDAAAAASANPANANAAPGFPKNGRWNVRAEGFARVI